MKNNNNNKPIIERKVKTIKLWHGSKSSTLDTSGFDKERDGTGLVTSSREKYGAFFLASDKERAEYYTENNYEFIDINEVDIEVYGNNDRYFYFVKKINFEEGEEGDYSDDLEEEIVLNGGPFENYKLAEESAKKQIKINNKCLNKNINPFLYQIELSYKKPYFYNGKEKENIRELIKKISQLNYDCIIKKDVVDGAPNIITDVYVVFNEKQLKVVNKIKLKEEIKLKENIQLS